MTGKGDRKHPETPYDKTRGNVALAKLATALGVRLDSSLPDHVLLERLAEEAETQADDRAYPDSRRDCECT